MRIQSIQLTNNINHKAKFIRDNKGNFDYLWERIQIESILDDEVEKVVNRFAKRHIDHPLEIKSLSYASKAIAVIFNHKTGQNYTFDKFKSFKDLLNDIIDNRILFDKNSKTARMYKALTGQSLIFD